MKTTLTMVHADADREFARQAAAFWESECDVVCDAITVEGALPECAEEGLAADALAILFSEASCGAGWKRDRWEPVLEERARVVSVQLGECRFPELFKRQNFFDARAGRVRALRGVKRWISRWARKVETPARGFSADLEELYLALADQPGICAADASLAGRFAHEAADDFEAVIWVASASRSLAQAAGQLGAVLGLTLEGTAEENWKCKKYWPGAAVCW